MCCDWHWGSTKSYRAAAWNRRNSEIDTETRLKQRVHDMIGFNHKTERVTMIVRPDGTIPTIQFIMFP